MGAPTVRDVGKSNSFYSFLDDYCFEKFAGHPYNRAFHRLCSLMRKMDVKTAIIEELDRSNSIIGEECAALETRLGAPLVVRVFRLVFVSKKVSTPEEIMSLGEAEFLSDAIVMNVALDATATSWRNYVFQAVVVKPHIAKGPSGPLPLLNNYIHVQKDFTFELDLGAAGKKAYRIHGSFFCQQNQLTSVCAHASLVMTVNNMKASGLQTISTEFINKTIGIDHQAQKIGANGREGLYPAEIENVLKQCGLSTIRMDFFANPLQEYDQFVYQYIESRCPVLLAFTTRFKDAGLESHVVPVLGHTLNSDMWRPEAESYVHPATRLQYKNSSAWVDHFIIHDDNFGMYFCLPVGALKRTTMPKYDPSFRACYAIAVVPD